ncbi:hypothetical protein R3P38DRAFT_2759341 [Favolaschia claudopus]|uniref:Uncharacterized protein n=1 Tax=Favolaschia claudopus TaxID=2862362 RepID=A0AAW0E883_9AGAR
MYLVHSLPMHSKPVDDSQSQRAKAEQTGDSNHHSASKPSSTLHLGERLVSQSSVYDAAHFFCRCTYDVACQFATQISARGSSTNTIQDPGASPAAAVQEASTSGGETGVVAVADDDDEMPDLIPGENSSDEEDA